MPSFITYLRSCACQYSRTQGSAKCRPTIHCGNYSQRCWNSTNETVVGIIQEATVGCRGHITSRIVGKHFLCQNIVVRILDGSLDDMIQAIITITEFGAFVKAFFCDDFRQYLCLFALFFFLRKILYLIYP